MFLNLSVLLALSNITFDGMSGRSITTEVGDSSQQYIIENATILITTKLANGSSANGSSSNDSQTSRHYEGNVSNLFVPSTTTNAVSKNFNLEGDIFENNTVPETSTESMIYEVSETPMSERISDTTSDDVIFESTTGTYYGNNSELLLDDVNGNETYVTMAEYIFGLISEDSIENDTTTTTDSSSDSQFSDISEEYRTEISENKSTVGASTTESVTPLIFNTTPAITPGNEAVEKTTPKTLDTGPILGTTIEHDLEIRINITGQLTLLQNTTEHSTTSFTKEDSTTITSTTPSTTKAPSFDLPTNRDISGVLDHLDCGRRPPRELSSWYRVVGGSPSHMFEWPWVISLRSRDYHSCGATLILPRFLLTAAHCVGVGKNLVAMGATETIKVKKTYIHPGFWRHYDDIALVELEDSFYNLNPICLEKSVQKLDIPMFIAGWGATKEDGFMSHGQLMSAEIARLPDAACSKAYGRYFTSSMICAGATDGSTDACHGDSGGPLMQEVNGTWFLKGIISYGKGCGREDSPGVYMKGLTFRNWIASKVQSLI